MYKCLNVLFALVIVSLWPTAWSQETRADDSPKTWTQAAEAQPVMEQGADDPEESSAGRTNDKPRISEKEFNAGPRPDWIWGDDNDANYVLATSFEASDIVAARLMASCDNVGTVFVNNKQVATGTEWQEAMSADVSRLIVNGKNTITAQVENQGGVAAFVLKLAMKDSEGNVTHVVSDLDWTLRSKNLTNGQKVAGRGAYGDSPWGNVFSNVAAVTRIPRGTFEVLPGFQVEKLFTVPKDELGSWVCIAFDNKGRLLASDQGGKGICRITPAALDGSTETVVEHLDFSSCEFQPSGAQGMLWAFDSLYFCCNGGPGSGLYRARDNDGDDQFDECVRLKQFRGWWRTWSSLNSTVTRWVAYFCDCRKPHRSAFQGWRRSGERQLHESHSNELGRRPAASSHVGRQRTCSRQAGSGRLDRQHRSRRQDLGFVEHRLPQSIRHGVQRRR